MQANINHLQKDKNSLITEIQEIENYINSNTKQIENLEK